MKVSLPGDEARDLFLGNIFAGIIITVILTATAVISLGLIMPGIKQLFKG